MTAPRGEPSTHSEHREAPNPGRVLTVHHLENSRSQRVLWLMEELGLPYAVKRYARDKKTMLAPLELRRIHRLGKSPVIEDFDTNGGARVITETGAIVEYLVEKADGRFGPPAARDEALSYRQFLHYAEGSLMPVLFAKLVLGRVPFLGGVAARKFQPMIDVHSLFVEEHLSRTPWFAGLAFTAADVMMSYPLEVARTRAGATRSSHPHTFDWLERVHARPAYQAALERGGPYVLGG